MLLFIIIFLILLVLLFIPLPIKVNIIANKKNFKVYFYKWLIFSFKDKKKQNKTNKKEKNKKSLINLRALISTLYYNKFKPKLKFNFNFDYSLNDASHTAILYGYSNLISSLILNILSLIFTTKKFSTSINPLFKNDNIFFLNINCIIYINFAKIIYTFVLYLYNCKIYNGR